MGERSIKYLFLFQVFQCSVMHFLGYFVCISFLVLSSAKKSSDDAKPDWAKKKIQDYSDADLERLLDQWEEDDEPLPPDELPDGHPDIPSPAIDFSNIDMNNPEGMIK